MKRKKKSDLGVLLDYAGSYKCLTFLGLTLSAVSMLLSMAPYICIWLAARDLIVVAPEWTQAQSVTRYGWMAFAFAVGGIVLYFAGLMCTHLAAFRTAENIRKQGVAHVMKAPLGYFDSNASGLIRSRLDAAAADTETLLAHNLADIVGTVVLFLSMLVMMLVFDWRMGAACLLAAVISVIAMFSMMGGKNAGLMAEYQAAQDRMTKAGTEYVRGIPVVKIFQQTVYSFRAFQQAIEDYSTKAEHYQSDVCRVPQAINLTFTEGAFVFLVPAALFLAPDALAGGNFSGFVTNFAFYAVFSAVISTALAKIMFAASGMMLATTALGRINQVMEAPVQEVPADSQTPRDNRVEFQDVTFTYEGGERPALSHVSFTAEPGQTVALVGPSGGGKTTAASLIPRFWDPTSGVVRVGGDEGGLLFLDVEVFFFQVVKGFEVHVQGVELFLGRFALQLLAVGIVYFPGLVNELGHIPCPVQAQGFGKGVAEDVAAVAVLYQLHEAPFAHFVGEEAVGQQGMLVAVEQRHGLSRELPADSLQVGISQHVQKLVHALARCRPEGAFLYFNHRMFRSMFVRVKSTAFSFGT